MNECPYCGFQGLGQQLRCPQCHQALTHWRNWDTCAAQSYRAGLHALANQPERATEFFCRAVTFAPRHPDYLLAFGCSLARSGSLSEASVILERAQAVSASENIHAALGKVRKLMDSGGGSTVVFAAEPETQPETANAGLTIPSGDPPSDPESASTGEAERTV